MDSAISGFAKSNGFPYSDGIIMEFTGGSTAHGAKLEGTDDTDYCGIFIEPPEKVCGVDSFEHFVFSTGGKPGGNNSSDVDLVLYSLRKWAGLACKGNPSVLHYLFAPNARLTIEWGQVTTDLTPFIAKSHLSAFFGYANAQLNRLYNGRGPKDVNRPFLEAQHGYDTKYAMHIVRLLGEAKELMTNGKITLPRPDADFLRGIREGKMKLYELESVCDQMMQEARQAQLRSDLPERPDRAEISKRIANAYRMHWDRTARGFWN